MARTEEQLRAYYGEHPPEGARCTDAECVQCEMRDLLATIDALRGFAREFAASHRHTFGGPSTMRTSERWIIYVNRWKGLAQELLS